MRIRLLTPLLLMACLVAQPVGAIADNDQAIVEAKRIFQILAKEAPDPIECLVDNRWYDDTLPEEVGRKYFGVNAQANRTPPRPFTKPSDIFELRPENSFIFCESKEKTTHLDDLLRNLIAAQKNSSKAPSLSYSFPIFDKKLQTAAVIVSSINLHLYRKDGADQYETFVAVDAHVFRKFNGAWREIDVVEMGRN